MHEVKEKLKEIVREKGYRVEIDTKYCKMVRENHQGCRKCESYIGCKKLTDIAVVMIASMVHKPKSLEEFFNNMEFADKRIQKILEEE